MAEIRVEPKRRSLAWLWVLLLLVIAAAVAWWLLYGPGHTSGGATSSLVEHVRVAAGRLAATGSGRIG